MRRCIDKVPATVTSRERTLAETNGEFFTVGKDTDPVADCIRTRRAAVEKASEVLQNCVAIAYVDRAALMSLDGRAATRMDVTEILTQQEEKYNDFKDVIRNQILWHQSAKGT